MTKNFEGGFLPKIFFCDFFFKGGRPNICFFVAVLKKKLAPMASHQEFRGRVLPILNNIARGRRAKKNLVIFREGGSFLTTKSERGVLAKFQKQRGVHS